MHVAAESRKGERAWTAKVVGLLATSTTRRDAYTTPLHLFLYMNFLRYSTSIIIAIACPYGIDVNGMSL